MPDGRPRNPRELKQEFEVGTIHLAEEEACALLQSAEIAKGYRTPWGSNYTFFVWIDDGSGKYLRAIYKPRDGERPLHDFPSGSLYKRELATFILSRGLGWPNVPLTLIREGPYGVGSVQLYIECDAEITYFDMIHKHSEELLKFAVFDMIINNADRKATHCLLDKEGHLWSIDHGLTFHHIFKLRTIMLEFWGKTIPEVLLSDMEALQVTLESSNELVDKMAELITAPEMASLLSRLETMRRNPVLPTLDPYYNVPWPWV